MAIDTDDIRAFLDESHHSLSDELSAWTEDVLGALDPCHDDEAARQQARHIVKVLGGGNWLSNAIPQTDLRACCLIREALAYHSPLADATFALQCLGSVPLLLAGSDQVKDRWLASVVKGDAMAAFAMTEPDAGSDVAAMSTRAHRDGYDYVINGTKHLITNAGIADFYTVFASTDPDAGSRGISCFVVPADTAGLVFERAQVLSEPHPLGVLRFEDCRVAETHRIGDEGAGFTIGMATLDRLRPTVAAAACGMGARALAEAVFHARTRHQFGHRLADLQMIQSKLAQMAMELTAARLMVYRAAWEKDQGADRITVPAAMAKAFATEAAQRIIDQAVQVIGGRGVLAEHPVDRLYRAIRPLRIYEGTTEVQYLIIAKALLRAADRADSALLEGV